jgi:hypothetical protein
MRGLHGSVPVNLKPHALLLLVLVIFALTASTAHGQTGSADLSLTMTGSLDAYVVTYTTTVRNIGPDAASHVSVTAPQLIYGAAGGAASASQGSCGFRFEFVIVCDLGTLAAGAHATVTQRYMTFFPVVLTNCATVSAATPDPNPFNNGACATTHVP